MTAIASLFSRVVSLFRRSSSSFCRGRKFRGSIVSAGSIRRAKRRYASAGLALGSPPCCADLIGEPMYTLDKAAYFLRAAKFNTRRYVKGFTIDSDPAFETEGLEFFRSVILQSKVYLEYGSGGSTILAAQYVSKLVSVESDRIFARAVKNALPQCRADIHMLSPAIGFTREWGYPVFERPTPSRVARWRRYSQAPWPLLDGDVPDTILIDGRARVACALETLIRVPRSSLLIVDDYVGRSYSAIENFADIVSLHGRMAVFRKRHDFDRLGCEAMLNLAYCDMR
jgi:hypothetical protein